jgi:hypothetical protein
MSKVSDFEQPRPLPFDLTVDMVTLGEAASSGKTRAILERVAPGYVAFADVDYLSRMSLRQTAYWGVVSHEDIELIDAELAKLAPSEWPVEPVE